MSNKITIIDGDDWKGVYVGGMLIEEGHEVTAQDMFRLMKAYMTFNVEFLGLTVDGMEWLDSRGNFPPYITDVPKDYIV